MKNQKVLQYHQLYLARKINEYELADLLGLEYTEIGAYIMSKGLRVVK